MQKISILIFTLFLSFNLILPALGQDTTFPESDFFLYLGVRKIGTDPMAGQRVEKILFSSANVNVKSGKITADKLIPISFKNGNQDFNGTASLNMTGDYDKSDGKLSGNFSMILDMNDIWHGGVSNVKSDWIDTINGTFIGQVVNDKVVILYKGKNNEEAHLGQADGSVKNDSISLDYNTIVVWRISELSKEEEPKTSEPDKTFVDSKARFSGMTGQVEWRADDDPDGWKLCKMDDKLPVYAHIRTQENSSVILGFGDMSTFVLKPESEVVIDTPPEKESKIKLVAGNIWVNVKKMITDGSMEIEMNQAVAGIKGTTFVASEMNGVSNIKVIEGKIGIKAKDSTDTVDIVGGESANIDKTGKIIKENFDILAEQDTWDNLEKIDFATLEESLSSVETTSPTSNNSVPVKSNDQNQTPLYIVIIAVVLIGGIVVFVLRKRK